MSPRSNFSIFYFHLCLPFKPFVFFSSPTFLFCYWFPLFPCVWLISPMSLFNFPSVPFRPMSSPPPVLSPWSYHAMLSSHFPSLYLEHQFVPLFLRAATLLTCFYLCLGEERCVIRWLATRARSLFSSCLSLSLPQITTKWATWDFASLFEVLFTLPELKIEIALSATKIWDDTTGHLLQIASSAMPLSTSIHPSIHPANSSSRVRWLRAGSYLSMHIGRAKSLAFTGLTQTTPSHLPAI